MGFLAALDLAERCDSSGLVPERQQHACCLRLAVRRHWPSCHRRRTRLSSYSSSGCRERSSTCVVPGRSRGILMRTTTTSALGRTGFSPVSQSLTRDRSIRDAATPMDLLKQNGLAFHWRASTLRSTIAGCSKCETPCLRITTSALTGQRSCGRDSSTGAQPSRRGARRSSERESKSHVSFAPSKRNDSARGLSNSPRCCKRLLAGRRAKRSTSTRNLLACAGHQPPRRNLCAMPVRRVHMPRVCGALGLAVVVVGLVRVATHGPEGSGLNRAWDRRRVGCH